MSILFSFLDMLLIIIMLFDTLGLIYQFRKKYEIKSQEYIRIYSSWILFLVIYNTFSCNWKGFFGTLIRLLLFAAKVYVTIPIINGSSKIHKFLIDDDNAKIYFNKILDMLKSKCCKSGKSEPCDSSTAETVEPEITPVGRDISNEQ